MTTAPTIKRVYKYQLVMGGWSHVYMPEGAEVLCVQVQNAEPFIWARITVGAPPVMYHFRIAGTGHDLGSNVGRYIGTFQLDGGALVFHVFAESGT
jgi:hypothetical protein